MPSRYLDAARLERQERCEYDFDDRLDGRVVLVAGGTGGLGAAIGAWLLDAGAGVVLGYHADAARAERICSLLSSRYGREVRRVAADITSDAGRRDVLQAIDGPEMYGAVIAVGDPARVAAEELDIERLQESLAVNYSGPVLLARDCARALQERGTPGAVVLLSSMQGVAPFAGSLNYAGPKAALVQAARVLAQDHGGPSGVRVNVVAPGVTAAGMALSSIERGKYDPYIDDGVIARFGRPEDVARAVGFLMAPDSYVTGNVLLVDGGLTLRRGGV